MTETVHKGKAILTALREAGAIIEENKNQFMIINDR